MCAINVMLQPLSGREKCALKVKNHFWQIWSHLATNLLDMHCDYEYTYLTIYMI